MRLREKPILRFYCHAVETFRWNHVVLEGRARQRISDDIVRTQGQQFGEVALPHVCRRHATQVEGVRGNALAIPQRVEEGLVLDNGTGAAEVEGVVDDLGLFRLEKA